MTIMHVSISIDRIAGGPSAAICDMALSQAKKGINVVIFSGKTSEPLLSESPRPNLSVALCDSGTFKKSLRDAIRKHQPDIIHGHGLWQIQMHHMAKLARKSSIPYIITPHGTLHPWALNVKKWKKKLALMLYQFADLKAAAGLHATSTTEASYFRAANLNNPIAVIPNGVDLIDFPMSEKVDDSKQTVLFLSRIHSQKGLGNLIDAWHLIDTEIRKSWTLEIAGEGDANYILELNQIIAKYGLTEQVILIGPQYGAAKLQAYHRAGLFVLPTFSENFGIVVAEALATGIPVITTKGAPWEDLELHQCGWWIDVGVRPLKTALETAMSTDRNKLNDMGRNGRKLIEDRYSIDAVATQTLELYSWILNKSVKPKFVQ